jgi:hypothetical protein
MDDILRFPSAVRHDPAIACDCGSDSRLLGFGRAARGLDDVDAR